MKKYIVGGVVVLSIFFAPLVQNAQAFTSSEAEALISALGLNATQSAAVRALATPATSSQILTARLSTASPVERTVVASATTGTKNTVLGTFSLKSDQDSPTTLTSITFRANYSSVILSNPKLLIGNTSYSGIVGGKAGNYITFSSLNIVLVKGVWTDLAVQTDVVAISGTTNGQVTLSFEGEATVNPIEPTDITINNPVTAAPVHFSTVSSSAPFTSISPTSGNQLITGQSVPITWVTNVSSAKRVNIWLIDNVSQLGRIILSNIPNNGSANWTVAPLTNLTNAAGTKVTPSGQYVLRIQCTDFSCGTAQSVAFFTMISCPTGYVCEGNSSQTPVQASLTIGASKPTVDAGDTADAYSIPSGSSRLFTVSNLTNQNFYVPKDSSLIYTTSHPETLAGDTATSLIITPGIQRGIVIENTRQDGANILVSKSNLSIQANAQASITILSPNGGEAWSQNDQQQIRWTSRGLNASDTINVYFVNTNGAVCTNGTTPGVNNIYWIYPNSAGCSNDVNMNLRSGGQYKIRLIVTNSGGKSVSDESDTYFTIASGTNTQTAPAPVISSISPASAVAGTLVDVYGTNLKNNPGSLLTMYTSSTVNPGSVTLAFRVISDSAANSHLQFTVPNYAYGAYKIGYNNGQASNYAPFTLVAPTSQTTQKSTGPAVLTSLSARSGLAGSTVYLYGTNLKSSDGVSTPTLQLVTDNGVTQGSARLSYNWINDTSVSFYVPNYAYGPYKLVWDNGADVGSNKLSFNIDDPSKINAATTAGTSSTAPVISSVSPRSGVAGTNIDVYGSNLKNGNNVIRLNSAAMSYQGGISVPYRTINDGAANSHIQFTVPNYSYGAYNLYFDNGEDSNLYSFTVDSPAAPAQTAPSTIITSISPNSGVPGAVLHLYGSNLISGCPNAYLSMSGVHIALTPISNSEMTFVVPNYTYKSYPVYMNGSNCESNISNFTIAAPSTQPDQTTTNTSTTQATTNTTTTTTKPAPVITSISPASAVAGSVVHVYGTNLLGTGSHALHLNGVRLEATWTSDTDISFIVPNYAYGAYRIYMDDSVTESNVVNFSIAAPATQATSQTTSTGTSNTNTSASAVTLTGVSVKLQAGAVFVTLTGTNFAPANNTIYMNGSAFAQYPSADGTTITIGFNQPRIPVTYSVQVGTPTIVEKSNTLTFDVPASGATSSAGSNTSQTASVLNMLLNYFNHLNQ